MITLLHVYLLPPITSWWDITAAMFFLGLDYTFRFPVLPRRDNP